MSDLDNNRVRQALLAAKIQSFSSELVALQSCRNDDELYDLLVKSVEGEPFLMSRVVRVANSAAFAGRVSGYAVGASECLMRIGLMTGKQIAEDFLIDQALGRIARANRFSRSVWREARLAGAVSYLFASTCEPPFDAGGPSLPALMSYLGELLIMSLVKAEYEMPKLVIPPATGVSQLNVVELSLQSLSQMQLPAPVQQTLEAVAYVGSENQVPYRKSAAAVCLSRALVQMVLGGRSYTASLNDEVLRSAQATLNLSEAGYKDIVDQGKTILRRPGI